MTGIEMTRKEFLRTAAGAVAVTALPGRRLGGGRDSPAPSAACLDLQLLRRHLQDRDAGGLPGSRRRPGRGRRGHRPGDPRELAHRGTIRIPSDAWVAKWFEMCRQYRVRPVEYGHWVDSKLRSEKEPWLSTRGVVRDAGARHQAGEPTGIHLRADQAGSDRRAVDSRCRTGGSSSRWRCRWPKSHNVRMMPEIHPPTRLKSKMIDDYVDFIEKEKTTSVVRPQHRLRRVPESPASQGGMAPDRPAGRAGEAPGGRSGARGSMGGGANGTLQGRGHDPAASVRALLPCEVHGDERATARRRPFPTRRSSRCSWSTNGMGTC